MQNFFVFKLWNYTILGNIYYIIDYSADFSWGFFCVFVCQPAGPKLYSVFTRKLKDIIQLLTSMR